MNLKENSSLILKLCYFQYLCSKMSKFNSALVCTVLYSIQRIAAHIKIQFSGERVNTVYKTNIWFIIAVIHEVIIKQILDFSSSPTILS